MNQVSVSYGSTAIYCHLVVLHKLRSEIEVLVLDWFYFQISSCQTKLGFFFSSTYYWTICSVHKIQHSSVTT